MASIEDLNVGDWVRPIYGKAWLGRVIDLSRGEHGYHPVTVEPYKTEDAVRRLRGCRKRTYGASRLEKILQVDRYLQWQLYMNGTNPDRKYPAGFMTLEEMLNLSREGWRRNYNFTNAAGLEIHDGSIVGLDR